MPKFVDEGITSDVAAEINSNYGSYKHGFWNRFLGKTDMEEPTNNGPEDGVTSIFNENGTISYFTDFTNPNTKSDSALGYSMINARTGELTYYKANGIMDSSGAKSNANQNYKAQQWTANMPILYQIVYTIDTDDFVKANLLRSGDNVSFKANVVNGQSIGNVTKFTNHNLK